MRRKAGIMLSEISFCRMPLLLKSAGYDFFILDCEHGGFDYREVSDIVSTAKLSGIECIIRLADNSRKDIIKYMDMGTNGVLLPMTGTADDIERVVASAKYSPIGKRGVSTMRAHTLYDPPHFLEYMRTANHETKVFAQIETAKGVSNAAAILAVPGVDGFFLGPNDLSDDYGCLADDNSKRIHEAMQTLIQHAGTHAKLSGIITANENYLQTAKSLNMHYFCVGSELSLLKTEAKRQIKHIKQ